MPWSAGYACRPQDNGGTPRSSRPARKPGSSPNSSAVRCGRGGQLQLRAVVGGAVGQFGAVPGDDLADPQRGQRPEQVVAPDEQLPGRSPRPGRGEQFGG